MVVSAEEIVEFPEIHRWKRYIHDYLCYAKKQWIEELY